MPPSQHQSIPFLQNNAKPNSRFSQVADFNLESEFILKSRSWFCEKWKSDSLAFGKYFTLLSSLSANTSWGILCFMKYFLLLLFFFCWEIKDWFNFYFFLRIKSSAFCQVKSTQTHPFGTSFFLYFCLQYPYFIFHLTFQMWMLKLWTCKLFTQLLRQHSNLSHYLWVSAFAV